MPRVARRWLPWARAMMNKDMTRPTVHRMNSRLARRERVVVKSVKALLTLGHPYRGLHVAVKGQTAYQVLREINQE